MKHYCVMALAAMILVAAAPGLAATEGRGNLRNCNPAGTWYEFFGPPFLLNVTPIQGHSRFTLNFEGTFNPEDFGYASLTNFVGEMRKGKKGFDAAAIATGGEGATFPHYPVATLGVTGTVEFDGNCDTLRVRWINGVRLWPWPFPGPGVFPPIPFVDEPIFLDPGQNDVIETYFRMVVPRN